MSQKSVSGLPHSKLLKLLCSYHPIHYHFIYIFIYLILFAEQEKVEQDFASDEGISDLREGYPSDFLMRKHFDCWNKDTV